MRLILSAGSLFGTIAPPTTTTPDNYHYGSIKKVIYLIGDGMGYNHIEKTKQERAVEIALEYAREDGEIINNYEVSMRIAYVLGLDESAFPCEVTA